MDFLFSELKKKQPLMLEKELETLYAKTKKSEDYTDAEILVYNSMLNMSRIIAKHL
jgi:hypothetical protein